MRIVSIEVSHEENRKGVGEEDGVDRILNRTKIRSNT